MSKTEFRLQSKRNNRKAASSSDWDSSSASPGLTPKQGLDNGKFLSSQQKVDKSEKQEIKSDKEPQTVESSPKEDKASDSKSGDNKSDLKRSDSKNGLRSSQGRRRRRGSRNSRNMMNRTLSKDGSDTDESDDEQPQRPARRRLSRSSSKLKNKDKDKLIAELHRAQQANKVPKQKAETPKETPDNIKTQELAKKQETKESKDIKPQNNVQEKDQSEQLKSTPSQQPKPGDKPSVPKEKPVIETKGPETKLAPVKEKTGHLQVKTGQSQQPVGKVDNKPVPPKRKSDKDTKLKEAAPKDKIQSQKADTSIKPMPSVAKPKVKALSDLAKSEQKPKNDSFDSDSNSMLNSDIMDMDRTDLLVHIQKLQMALDLANAKKQPSSDSRSGEINDLETQNLVLQKKVSDLSSKLKTIEDSLQKEREQHIMDIEQRVSEVKKEEMEKADALIQASKKEQVCILFISLTL